MYWIQDTHVGSSPQPTDCLFPTNPIDHRRKGKDSRAIEFLEGTPPHSVSPFDPRPGRTGFFVRWRHISASGHHGRHGCPIRRFMPPLLGLTRTFVLVE